MITNCLNTVPEATLWLSNILDERQELYETDKGGDEDGDAGEDDGVVKDGYHVA
jgi:hypothetical protein